MAYTDDRAVRLAPVINSVPLQGSGSNMDSFFRHGELTTKERKEKKRKGLPHHALMRVRPAIGIDQRGVSIILSTFSLPSFSKLRPFLQSSSISTPVRHLSSTLDQWDNWLTSASHCIRKLLSGTDTTAHIGCPVLTYLIVFFPSHRALNYPKFCSVESGFWVPSTRINGTRDLASRAPSKHKNLGGAGY